MMNNDERGEERAHGGKTYWDAHVRSAFQAVLMRFGTMFTLTNREYILNNEPNRIDQLIIKHTEESVDDAVAEFFREFNVMEFKSSRDKLGIRDKLLSAFIKIDRKMNDTERSRRNVLMRFFRAQHAG